MLRLKIIMTLVAQKKCILVSVQVLFTKNFSQRLDWELYSQHVGKFDQRMSFWECFKKRLLQCLFFLQKFLTLIWCCFIRSKQFVFSNHEAMTTLKVNSNYYVLLFVLCVLCTCSSPKMWSLFLHYRKYGRCPWWRKIVWFPYDGKINRQWRWPYWSCAPGDLSLTLCKLSLSA